MRLFRSFLQSGNFWVASVFFIYSIHSTPNAFAVKSTRTIKTNLDQELLKAADLGYVKRMRYLLNKGANIDAISENGSTPLSLAIRARHPKASLLLLRRGADINKLICGKRSYLQLAAQTHAGPELIEVIKLLINKGADINYKSDEPTSLTPLSIALLFLHKDIAKILIDLNAKGHRILDRLGDDLVDEIRDELQTERAQKVRKYVRKCVGDKSPIQSFIIPPLLEVVMDYLAPEEDFDLIQSE